MHVHPYAYVKTVKMGSKMLIGIGFRWQYMHIFPTFLYFLIYL